MNEKHQLQMALLWAKADKKEPASTHLLIYHLLESAAVALSLWNHVFSESIKHEYAGLFNTPVHQFGKILAYWVSLHDLGKASPVFQYKIASKNPGLINQIQSTGLSIATHLPNIYHSKISGKFLREHQLTPKEVEVAITGHHGSWDTNYRGFTSHAYGDNAWDQIRKAYCDVLHTVLKIDDADQLLITDVTDSNNFTVWLSGLITVADWIASDESGFQYHHNWIEPSIYFNQAIEQATKRLRELGWIGWRPEGKLLSFQEMYAFKGWDGPRPVQAEVINAYHCFQPEKPFVMIVEAPTGIGKTEIAMFLADRWLQAQQGSGLYIAMPSQATSNQLFERSKEVLKHRYDNHQINLVLSHGQARWNDALNEIRIQEVGEEPSQGLIAGEWFLNNLKRTLLAPFGVGTVDQIFLSILQTKHFFVRLFGLKNKVIIFDEVHAYDTYMNTLFFRLLEWLQSLKVSVIILSATLPDKTRKKITSHYCGIDNQTISASQDYPRVTMASAQRAPVVTPIAWKEKDRIIDIHWIEQETMQVLLQEKLTEGGCAAVICNTVRQAQDIYRQIKALDLVEPHHLILFHARFPFAWRKEIEDRVLKLFGKDSTTQNGLRPNKAVVVATQVIEQSLDLDFDFMVSELAPIDLILQRAGRLHRHERGDSRPKKLHNPELNILHPEKDAEGNLLFGEREPFYQQSLLAKTFFHLQLTEQLKIIEMTRKLIEDVYQEEIDTDIIPPELIETIEMWQKEENSKAAITTDTAGFTIIPDPSHHRLTTRRQQQLSDDDSSTTIKHMRAKTRDGGISLRLPCLFTNDDGSYFYDFHCQEPVNINGGNINEMKKRLSENEISINHIGLIHTILNEGVDISQINAHLREQKVLVFNRGSAQIGKHVLRLSLELGLIFE